MYLKKFCLMGVFAVFAASFSFGQTPPAPSPTPKVSETLLKNIAGLPENSVTSRERREQAYAKLLEGQRYVWTSLRLRSQAGIASTARLARKAIQEAVELDPTLAEGYTALAELAITSGSADIEEAISLATIATKIEPNNFGGRRILARLYTVKSHLTGGTYDPALGEKAIAEWKHVTRLDPRNAEGWALLGAYYEKTEKPVERIDALKKWLGSAAPIDVGFYRLVMGGRESLSPEAASLKLGPALLKAGKTQEAIETLSVLVADDPDNEQAVDLLREAIESSRGQTALAAIEGLQSAVYANPGNFSLINLLAQVHARAGKVDESVVLLRGFASKTAPADRNAASGALVSLGELYSANDRHSEAIKAFDDALEMRGLHQAMTLADDKREFAMYVFEKMIQTLKAANRPDDVHGVIERARKLFGKDDLFSDRQLISFYREAGKRQEALATIRSARAKHPSDFGFIRLEATLLAELGKVDEGVAIIRKLMEQKPASPTAPVQSGSSGTVAVAVPAADDFSNYLFISSLYTQAGRGKEAAEAANQAHGVARGNERKQIAKLTLATAQQMSGDMAGAEVTLRQILQESPGNPIALNNLGYFLVERNERLEEAKSMIEQALKVDPTNPSYLDSMGWACFKLGKLDEAERYLKDASRFDSGSGTIQEHLGDVYSKQGKPDLAKAAWGKALSLASDAADIARLKGKLGIKATK